jgi:hypothetical protein
MNCLSARKVECTQKLRAKIGIWTGILKIVWPGAAGQGALRDAGLVEAPPVQRRALASGDGHRHDKAVFEATQAAMNCNIHLP